jgi:hypothetical protein
MFKKIPGLGTFCTQPVKEGLTAMTLYTYFLTACKCSLLDPSMPQEISNNRQNAQCHTTQFDEGLHRKKIRKSL